MIIQLFKVGLLLQRFHLWSLKWVFARSHIRSRHLGESLSCSLYIELAICIEMVGPVCQCCHFPCLGGLPSPTLRANGAVAGEFFRGSRAARPRGCCRKIQNKSEKNMVKVSCNGAIQFFGWRSQYGRRLQYLS